MHCLIIDDNAKTSATLSELLLKMEGITEVHKAVQPYIINSIMATETIEIVFTRVRLWNHRVFSQLPVMPVVVFLCGGKDKLTDQTDTAVPYKLREPYSSADTSKLMKTLRLERIIEEPSYLFVRHERRHHRIFFKDIDMIERLPLSYVRIHTKAFKMMVSGTLPDYLAKLPEGQFIRASDNLILPIMSLDQIKDNVFEYQGRKIEMTYRFAEAAKKEMETELEWNHWTGQD